MRIATWNVAYGLGKATNARRISFMAAIEADVWILTETHDSLSLTEHGYQSVEGPQRPIGPKKRRNVTLGSRWVSIWSRLPIEPLDLQLEDPRRVVACISGSDGQRIAVYGSVLPWANDTETDGMLAELTKQSAEWHALHHEHDGLCVAGDFNVNLGGPHYYGSEESKAAVPAALAEVGLVTATRFDRTPDLAHGLIDHIALPHAVEGPSTIHRIWDKRTDDDKFLSDHRGVAVDVPGW